MPNKCSKLQHWDAKLIPSKCCNLQRFLYTIFPKPKKCPVGAASCSTEVPSKCPVSAAICSMGPVGAALNCQIMSFQNQDAFYCFCDIDLVDFTLITVFPISFFHLPCKDFGPWNPDCHCTGSRFGRSSKETLHWDTEDNNHCANIIALKTLRVRLELVI